MTHIPQYSYEKDISCHRSHRRGRLVENVCGAAVYIRRADPLGSCSVSSFDACNVMLCYVMICNVMLCSVMLWNVMLCNVCIYTY